MDEVGEDGDHGDRSYAKLSKKKFSKLQVNHGDMDTKLEDQLTNEKLHQLERIFEEADEDGGGGLDMDEFRFAMRQALGQKLSDHELDLLFMKVDTNCDGTVDWDEYLSYMLLEYTEKDQMNNFTQTKPLPKQIQKACALSQKYSDSIVEILHVPNTIKLENCLCKVVQDRAGRYASVSKEGVLNFWNMDLKHLRSFDLNKGRSHSLSKNIWVTAMTFMANVNLIAVSTTACKVIMYDLTANVFQERAVITDLDFCALCMDYWFDDKDPTSASLLWGDGRGSICVVTFSGCPQVCVLHPHQFKQSKNKIPLPHIIRGFFCGISALVMPHVHDDFVKCIKYVPEMNFFISCSRANNTAMYLGDLEKKRPGSYFRVKKGINSFDYCVKNNAIITGGYDTLVRVWNPYVPQKPVMILRGHKSPITCVIVNGVKEQIISISEDRDICIFDMTTQVCIQTIFRQFVPLGERSITATLFNQKRQALLLATNQLAVFEHKEDQERTNRFKSHECPVTVVLFNKLFNVVVSAAADSVVSVWSVKTGERQMQFTAHKFIKNGKEKGIEITAMSFDPTLRRLFTGARDGSVKIWNFNNGACLRELEQFDGSEITGIVCFRHRIITAGWGRVVRQYLDNVDDETVRHWKKTHTEDILSLAYYLPSLVASGSYDGAIIIWSIETGRALAKLQITESKKPQTVHHGGADLSSLKVEVGACSESEETSQSTNETHDDLLVHDENKTNGGTESQNSRKSTAKSNQPKSVRLMKALRDMNIMKRSLPPLAARVRRQSQRFREEQMQTRNTTSVDKLVFLQKRKNAKDTAILLATGADGWVRAWSIHHEGGLLGQFNAAHTENESVLAMATEENNHFLITGDTQGYIKIWYIRRYCISKTQAPPDTPAMRQKLESKFVMLKSRAQIAKQQKTKFSYRCLYARECVRYPELVISFRGHTHAITTLDFCSESEQIVTGSSDCSLRLWTIQGQFIGLFGQETLWSTQMNPAFQSSSGICRMKQNKGIKVNLPPDVRRVASATTLQVLNGGMFPKWNFARNIILVWVPMLKPKATTSDFPVLSQQTESVVNSESLEDLREAGESDILGKNYKRCRKHQLLPELVKPREFMNQVAVYSSLPCSDLEEIKDIQPPPILEEMMNWKRSLHTLMQRHVNMRGATRMTKRRAALTTSTGVSHLRSRRTSIAVNDNEDGRNVARRQMPSTVFAAS